MTRGIGGTRGVGCTNSKRDQFLEEFFSHLNYGGIKTMNIAVHDVQIIDGQGTMDLRDSLTCSQTLRTGLMS